jgi:predicted nucleic acid-binding protein
MRRDTRIRARVAALAPEDRVVICTITRGEVLYGLERLAHGKRRSDLEAEAMHLFAQLACLPVSEEAADRYARIKREAELKGTPLDENDLWIAATALSLDALLVTMDSDFRRVNSLQVEDWTL